MGFISQGCREGHVTGNEEKGLRSSSDESSTLVLGEWSMMKIAACILVRQSQVAGGSVSAWKGTETLGSGVD